MNNAGIKGTCYLRSAHASLMRFVCWPFSFENVIRFYGKLTFVRFLVCIEAFIFNTLL